MSGPASPPSALRTCLVHMRLAFSLFLLPVYLVNLCVFVDGLDGSAIAVGVLLHVFLYTGSNAYNSYYDRDEGPIGGLESPPEVVPALLPFSLALQAIAILGSAWIDPVVGALVALFAAMSTAYSHPRTRWKGHPFGSLAVIFGGQGLIVAGIASRLGGVPLAGWTVTQASVALGASTAILGFYLFSHMYQEDEDAARGDRTFTVVHGADASLTWGLRLQAAGFALIGAGFTGIAWVVALAAVVAALGAQLALGPVRARLLAADPLQVFRRLMRLNWVMSTAVNGVAVGVLVLRTL